MESNRAYFLHQDMNEDGGSEGSVDERQYRKKSPSYYPSNTHGVFIVNAITGVKYPWYVGSKDARRLFRIVDTTGTHDKKGRKLKITSPDFPNPNPNNYYYDSPQQFMQHRKATLNPVLIEKWQMVQQEFSIVQEDQ